jgi:hypothetical protein
VHYELEKGAISHEQQTRTFMTNFSNFTSNAAKSCSYPARDVAGFPLVAKCPSPGTCDSNATCVSPWNGPLCSSCNEEQGLARWGSACVKCTPDTIPYGYIFTSGYYFLWSAWTMWFAPSKSNNGVGGIVVFFLQVKSSLTFTCLSTSVVVSVCF